MALLALFLLGIGNFALHRAVMESGHPMIERMSLSPHLPAQRVVLGLEFLVLLAAMLMTANGWPEMAWAYAGYSLLNGMSAWLVLSGRV